MKTTFLIILIFCAALSSAQNISSGSIAQQDGNLGENSGNRIRKGTLLTSGNFQYHLLNSDLTKYSSFNIGASALVAVSPRFGIGFTAGYKSENTKFESGSLTVNSTFNNFSIGPAFRAFGRTYWGWLQPFGQMDIPVSFGKSGSGQGKTKLSSFGVGVRPGLTAYLSRRLALETSLGMVEYVSNRSASGPAKSQTSNFNIGLGFNNVQFGLVFLFNSL